MNNGNMKIASALLDAPKTKRSFSPSALDFQGISTLNQLIPAVNPHSVEISIANQEHLKFHYAQFFFILIRLRV